jgi:hypothetical protein
MTEEQDEPMMRLTPQGHLAALLNRRWGIAIHDAADVWGVLCNILTHEAKQSSPACDAAAVVLVDGGEVIPLFQAEEPEIEEASDE